VAYIVMFPGQDCNPDHESSFFRFLFRYPPSSISGLVPHAGILRGSFPGFPWKPGEVFAWWGHMWADLSPGLCCSLFSEGSCLPTVGVIRMKRIHYIDR